MSAAGKARLLRQAKTLGAAYYRLTGRPLGVAGEVAEYEATRILGLRLLNVREQGADAVDAAGVSYQIKGRVLQSGTKNGRLGALNFSHPWRHCLLVLLSPELQATEIWQASRAKLRAACDAPGSKARNERRALPINVFKRVGKRVWPR